MIAQAFDSTGLMFDAISLQADMHHMHKEVECDLITAGFNRAYAESSQLARFAPIFTEFVHGEVGMCDVISARCFLYTGP